MRCLGAYYGPTDYYIRLTYVSIYCRNGEYWLFSVFGIPPLSLIYLRCLGVAYFCLVSMYSSLNDFALYFYITQVDLVLREFIIRFISSFRGFRRYRY